MRWARTAVPFGPFPFADNVSDLLKSRLSPSSWFWGIAVSLLVLVSLRFGILQRRAAALPDGPDAPVALVELAPNPEPPAFVGPQRSALSPPGLEVTADTLGPDDSIYLSLRRRGVADGQILGLVRALEPVFRPERESRPGDFYTVTLDTSGAIQSFRYTPRSRPERPVLVERAEDEFRARRLDLPLDTRLAVVETRIEDNLSNAVDAVGEGNRLTDLLADGIFGAVIDFYTEPRRGDRIAMVFEKLYLEGRFIRYGRVQLAEYRGQQVSQLAVYYEDPAGGRGYYDEDGKSLDRMFILSPVPYRTRISSGFSRRRFHPILKRPVPHLGTDYAAPTGARAWATARGRVVHAGWKGSYGKMVEIEHANGYRTRYAHLSRVAVKRGQRVEQQQVIGRVGKTGRATGAHLHYELIKNGRHQNPEKVNKGDRGHPLPTRYWPAFTAHRDRLLAQLGRDTGRLAAGEPE